jgi:hypothetical protein
MLEERLKEETLMRVEVNGVKFTAVDVYDTVGMNNTPCKKIELSDTTYEAVKEAFVDGAKWAVIYEEVIENFNEETGEFVEKVVETAHDHSAYSISGVITDYRNGRISIEMGQMSVDQIMKLFEEVL